MLKGIGIMAVIAIMGGIIAYIGDKLGTKVGKRRMSLFGLRPKHTSIIVTIITGILIATVTLGVLTAMSSTARVALFGMEQLKAEMRQLNEEVANKTKELENGKKALEEKNKELANINEDVKKTQADRDSISQELVSVQEAYSESQDKLAKTVGDVNALEETKAKMESHISNLQFAKERLEKGIAHVREGNVVFRNGEVLAGAVVRPGLSKVESESVIAGIINDTNTLILKKLNIAENKNVLYVSRVDIENVAKQISEATAPLTIRVTAAANIIDGEPAFAEIHAYDYQLIYKKGDIVWSSILPGGSDARTGIISFLKDINKAASDRGVLPDPITGDVGTMAGEELFRTIEEAKRFHGAFKIEAISKTDTYSDGPVQIELRIEPIN